VFESNSTSVRNTAPGYVQTHRSLIDIQSFIWVQGFDEYL